MYPQKDIKMEQLLQVKLRVEFKAPLNCQTVPAIPLMSPLQVSIRWCYNIRIF